MEWTFESIAALSDEELAELYGAVVADQQRRQLQARIPQQINDLNRDYLDAVHRQQGEEWIEPTGAHDAYPLDWVVTYNGKQWVSRIMSNTWEPGTTDCWEEVGEPGETPSEPPVAE